MRSADAIMPEAVQAGAARLPTPQQLARLGTVLCLYPRQPGGELAGWSQAVRAEAAAAVDSDGALECLRFYDRDDRCCWRLYLLPDSDFLAWERLATALPAHADPLATAGIGERLLRRLAGNLANRWTGSILRLTALSVAPGRGGLAPPAALAARLASVSALSATLARRIARDQGADAGSLVDECCCERAARAAAAGDAGDDAFIPIRTDPRPQANGPRA